MSAEFEVRLFARVYAPADMPAEAARVAVATYCPRVTLGRRTWSVDGASARLIHVVPRWQWLGGLALLTSIPTAMIALLFVTMPNLSWTFGMALTQFASIQVVVLALGMVAMGSDDAARELDKARSVKL